MEIIHTWHRKTFERSSFHKATFPAKGIYIKSQPARKAALGTKRLENKLSEPCTMHTSSGRRRAHNTTADGHQAICRALLFLLLLVITTAPVAAVEGQSRNVRKFSGSSALLMPERRKRRGCPTAVYIGEHQVGLGPWV